MSEEVLVSSDLQALTKFVQSHPKLCVLTGAGISTASGIPDYRDETGQWKRPAPVQYQEFRNSNKTRQRYWARSLVGWPWFKNAQPNANHEALVRLESSGRVRQIITQNVDRLHQHAGAKNVIDLHGRLDQVVCLDCGALTPRDPWQQTLAAENASFADLVAEIEPDGDAYLEHVDFTAFKIPGCNSCGGMLKPDVVFFGETVPKPRVEHAMRALHESDALLILGSSLMVYSGYRFCLKAAEWQRPMAVVNLGHTRADALLDLKIEQRCEVALDTLLRQLESMID